MSGIKQLTSCHTWGPVQSTLKENVVVSDEIYEDIIATTNGCFLCTAIPH
jgi:hypothetical protein